MKYSIIIIFLLFCFQLLYAKEIHVSFTDKVPSIDGNIGIEEWSVSDSASGFIQLEPDKGKNASEMTIVYVMQNADHLYIAFKCIQSDASSIVANISVRDQVNKSDDAIMVLLDTFDDQRNAFAFWVNPRGTQTDLQIYDDGRNTDINWDTEWQAASQRTSYGWSVEIAIPFRRIGYNENLDSWGINFSRIIRKNFETSYWSGLMTQDYRVSQSGRLTNLKLPTKIKNFMFTPYTTLRYENSDITGNYDETIAEVGLDASYLFTTGVVGNLTINPDFATVEGDQEQINLSRWELSFPEKRLFFLEGNRLYSTRIRTFYSRRIGDIDYGGKITGKINDYSFSAIGVRTTSYSEFSIPPAWFSTIRLKKDIFESSFIGITAVDKSWDNGYTRSLSADVLLNPGIYWKITGQIVTSAPGLTMKESAYFIRVAHESNLHHIHIRYSDTGENFRENVNQTGIIREDDMKEIDGALSYVFWPQNSFLKYISLESDNNAFWNHQDILRSWYLTQEVRFYLVNKFSLEFEYNNEYKLYEKDYYNHKYNVALGYNTDEWAYAEVEHTWGKNFDRDFQLYEFDVQYRFFEKLALQYSLKKLDFTPDSLSSSTILNVATVDYNFTRDLWIRVLAQSDSQINRIYFYGLFGWRFIPPFSAIYFIYTTDEFNNALNGGKLKNDIVFVKLSYQFGL